MIVVVVLGYRDLLDSGELLVQVTGDGLLLLPRQGGGTLSRPCLSRFLSVAATTAMKASCSWCATVCCSSTERLEVLPSMVSKTVVVRGGVCWR
jgi:Na+-transporting NADH:ubiquinone oxidoreductase subunit NqrF